MMRRFSAILLLGAFCVPCATVVASPEGAALPEAAPGLTVPPISVVTDISTEGQGSTKMGAGAARARPTSLRTEAARLYGTGVYACFAGDLATAQTVLDQSIQLYKKDPRVWYYRGLVRLRQGDTAGASRDFESGALIEMAQSGQMANISRALSQIQGTERQEIEQYRQNARRVKAEKYKAWCAARYEALQREEQRVLAQLKADEAAKDAADAAAAVEAKNALPEPKMPEGAATATATATEPAAAPASTTTDDASADPFAEESTGDTSTDGAPAADASAGETPADDASADPFAEESTGDASTDGAPAADASAGETPTDGTSADPFAEESTGDASTDGAPAADASAGETPTDGTSADNAPAADASADPFAENAADETDPFAE
ncbi:MAG: hypothetical protein PHE53_01315 [Thermoguttaceae bacterium]|nr:hypothetical protein [Thermoguttaceae bacterium]